MHTNADVGYLLLAIKPSQARRIKWIPRRALAYLLSQEENWQITNDLVKSIAEANEQPLLEVDKPITLPSESMFSYRSNEMPADFGSQILLDPRSSMLHRSVSTHADSTCSNTTRTPDGISSSSELHVSDPMFSSIPTECTFCWQSEAPTYKGGINTYIWQPYCKHPPFSYVKLNIFSTETTRNMKMLLLFSDTRSLCAFRARHQEVAGQRVASETWSPVTELATSILTIFKMILLATVEFLQSSSKELTRLVSSSSTRFMSSVRSLLMKRQTYESRAWPSVEKTQYLLHLNDCRKRAELDMERNKKQLNDMIRGIKSRLTQTQDLRDDIQRLIAQIDDLEHVKKQLSKLGRAINALRREVGVQDAKHDIPALFPPANNLLADRVSE